MGWLRVCRDAGANAFAWRFFRAHPTPARGILGGPRTSTS